MVIVAIGLVLKMKSDLYLIRTLLRSLINYTNFFGVVIVAIGLVLKKADLYLK